MSFKPAMTRLVLALFLLAGFSMAPSWGATSEFRILVNRDLNLNSGCDLTPTPPGPPGPPATRGLEQILIARVTTGPGTATVTSIAKQSCTNSATDTFGPPAPVVGATGAVGQNNGLSGFDVVELCLPASAIGTGPPPQARVGLTSSNLVGGTDLLLTPDGGNGNQPIFLALGVAEPIPTLSEWGLILMALLLAAAAATRLRKRPTAALAIFFILGMAGVALAVTVDGQIGDWVAGDKIGDDPIGDAPLGADLRALFARYENNQVCFRIDASLDIPPANGAPTVQNATFTVPENSANGTVVGTVVATDPDAGQTLTFSITGGNASGAFAINPATGQITVANSTPLDFETTPTFTLTVTATDNATPPTSGTGTITVNLTNVNEAPVVNDQSFNVAEGSANGTVVGTVAATDPEVPASQALTYAITAGNTGGVFAINAATGQITVANGAALDNETMPSFALTVTVTDNGTPVLSDTAVVTINVTDANDPPVANDATFSLPENSANGTAVGTATATDPDLPAQTLTFAITGGDPSGAFAINASTGAITVANSSALDFETTPTFTLTVTVTDNGTPNLSDTGTITVNLTDLNEAPVANDATFSVAENSPNGTAVGTVTATDQDVPAQTLTYAITVGNTGGAFAIDPATGQITVANSAAVDTETTPTFTLTVTVTDNGSPVLSDTATVTVNVTGVNEPPVADNDAYSVNEGGTLNEPAATGVLNGDTDPEGSTLTAVLDSGPAHASSFTLNADGSFTYTHDGSETPTTDTFTYHANDGTANSNVATVTITIVGANDAPVAANDSYSVNEGGTLSPAVPGVLSNDVDPDSALTAVLDSGPAHASSFTLSANGSFTYTHDGSETPTTDTFTYHASDGAASSNVATVTITINPLNDAPVLDLDADDSGGTTGSDFAITFTDGDPARLIEDPADATITDADNANLTTLTVTLTNLIDTGFEVLDVDLTGANPAFSKSYDTTTDPNKGVLTITASPARPVAEFVALLRKVTYVNTDGNPDTTSRIIQFVVSDGTSNSNTATTTVTISAVNNAPVADNDSYSVNEGATLTVPAATGVLNGDTDPEGDSLTAVLDSGPAHASSFTLNADGSFSYTHDGSETPTTDTFTYHATDGTSNSNVATVTITINPLNDAPTADNDAYSVNEGGTLTVPAATGVLNGDIDPEGTTLTAVLNAGPAHASSFTLNADGSFTYVHDGSETPLTDTFTYHATDGTASSNVATVTITINPVNDAPTAVNDSFNVNEGGTLNQAAPGVLAGDTDPEGSTLTAALVTGPAHASSFTLNANGSFTYTHDGSETPLTDTFTYRANDGTANSNVATVTITINPVNDAPVADNDSYSVNEGATLNVPAATGVLNGDTDAEGTTLTAVLDSGPAHASSFTLNADGSFSYTHDGSETPLTDTFTYHATDGTASSNVATVTITINPVNDPPVANPDTADITEEAPNVPAANTVSGNVLTNDTDPDSSLTVSAVAGGTVGVSRAGSFGSVIINSNGSFTYTLDDTNPTVNALRPGQMLTDSFGYTASDGSLTSSSTLTVTIHGADDPATPDNDAFDFIGNTELRVDLAAGSTPAVLATTPSGFGVADGDVDPEGDAITISGIVGCADLTAPFDCVLPGQGTISLQANGRFTFVPEAGDVDATASFQYTLVGNPALATVTLTRFARVWYVKNNAPGGGLGRSSDPFDTLVEAQTASLANDYIFIYFGDGLTTGQAGGISLKNGQHLIGEFAGLTVAFSPAVTFNGVAGTTSVPLVPQPGATACSGAPCRPMLNDTLVDAIEGVSAVNVVPAEIVGLNLAGNVNAIDWNTNAAFAGTGTLSIRDNVIRSATNEGVDINLAGTSAVSLAFHDNTITSSGTGLDIQETGTGSLTITQFANNAVTGTTGGTGINIVNATFDAVPGGGIDAVSGGTTVIGASGDPVGQAGLTISGMTGTLNFTDLDIFANGGTGLGVAGTGPATTTFTVGAGVGQIEANGGPAVNVSQTTVDLQLTSIKSTNSPGTGVSLDTVNGTFSAGSGSSIATATGTDFNVNAGTAAISYAGTITNTAGRSVSITNKTGGSTTFTGAITDTGTGVFMNSNGGSTMSFSGGLSLTTTTNDAFTATGGGTVTVTGAANTIATTTGVGLNVANTTIGATNLVFRSISAGTAASGPANGIILNTTGALGGLTVSGTGGAGTGGTIQRTTSDAIALTNTRSVSLSSMNVQNSSESGILGTTVNGLTLTACNFTNNGDDSADVGVRLTNISGAASFTNTNITGSALANMLIDNTAGTLSSFTISGGSYSSLGTAFGGNSILMNIRGTSTLTTGSISGVTFANNKPARAITVQAQDTATIADFTLQTSTFTNNGVQASFEQSGSANLTFKLLNNPTMTMTLPASGTSHAVNVFSSSTSTGGTVQGRIQGNTIGSAGVPSSGSPIGNGIRVFIQGRTAASLLIDGNVIRQIPQARGIDAQFLGPVTSGQPLSQSDITITNNDVNPQDTTGFPAAAIYIAADSQGGSPVRVRSDVRTNTVPAGAAVDSLPTFLIVDEVAAAAEAQLVDTAPASANCTAQLTSTNTGSASAAAGCALIAGPISTPP
jgi:VCBS repeat-containing protein